jgi:Secretion system C-terminal sorting domain
MGDCKRNSDIGKFFCAKPTRVLHILLCLLLFSLADSLFAQCPIPTISAGGPLTFCDGDSVVLSSSATTGNQWLKDGKKIKGSAQQNYTAKISGIYSVQSSNGKVCTISSLPLLVTVNALPPKPSVKADGSTVFCGGDSVKLTSSSPGGNQWLKDGVNIQNATSKTLVVKTSGIYQVMVSNGSCQSMSDALVVSAFNQTPLTILPAGPVTVCSGDSIVLSSSSTAGNLWFKNGIIIKGATHQTFVAKSAGNYTVQVLSQGGCNSTSSPITVNAGVTPVVPVITASDTLINCVYSKVLYSSSSTGNQWMRNGILINGEVRNYYIVNVPGSYSVEVSSVSGCKAASAESIILILINPNIPVITTSDPLSFCNGGSASLHSSPAPAYQWYNNGVIIGGATGQNYKTGISGSYTVHAMIGKCIFGSQAVNITVINNQTPATITPAGPIGVCSGETVVLNSSSSSGNQWYKDGVLISGATNQTYSASIAGSYTVKLMEGTCSTPFSSPVIVTSNKPVVPSITAGGPLSFCTGGSVILTASIASDYQWLKNGLAIANAINETYTATEAGSYTVNTKDAGGCQAISAAIVVSLINSMPSPVIAEVAPGPGPGCGAGATVLISSADLGNQWLKEGVAIPGEVQKTYFASETGNYSVALDFGGTCFSESKVVTVIGNTSANLKAIITANNGFLYSDSVRGNQWYLDDTLIAGATANTFIPQVSGKYTLQITNSNGCTSTFSDPVFAKVENFSSPNVWVFPNPVTDYIFVVNLGFHPVTARIFDIQGRTVITVRGLTGTNKINLAKLSSGSYVIRIIDEVTNDKTRNLILKY